MDRLPSHVCTPKASRQLLLRADRVMPSATLVLGPLVSSKHR
jgi:hypothetical protein